MPFDPPTPNGLRRLVAAVFAAMALVVSGCGQGPDTSGDADTVGDGGTSSPVDGGTSVADGGDDRGDGGTGGPDSVPLTTTSTRREQAALTEVSMCSGLASGQSGTVATPSITEASGVAVSREHDGVIWVHNDSGSAPAVIAVGFDGSELGVFELPDVSATDIEDIALVDGTLYLADIGDNNRRRDEIAVYRFAEPDPSAADQIGSVDTIRLRYPSAAFDAESLIVDPVTGQLVIIVKAVRIGGGGGSAPLSAAAAPIFVADPPFEGDQVVELVQKGVLALDELVAFATGAVPEGMISELGLGGVATAADTRPDGSTIAVRTYRSVWLFHREPDESVPDALRGVPCEAPSAFEPQGESIGFIDDVTNGFVTISEGLNPAVNVTRAD